MKSNLSLSESLPKELVMRRVLTETSERKIWHKNYVVLLTFIFT